MLTTQDCFQTLTPIPLNLRKSCNSRTRGVWSFSWVQSCRSRHRSSERERRAAQRVAEAQDATRGEPRPSGRAPVGYYWDPRPGEPTGTWRNLLTNEAMDLGAAKRDTKYAAELLGLRLDVPWSVWHGYKAGGREPGILWRYDAEERTFTVRFENELDLDDLEDVSWAEVLGTVPMAESAGEPAILHRLDELPLVRAPRGTQPQDGVWRMRGGLWINRHGMALYEEDAGESDSADDDELGSARPAASHTFTSHPLCNHRFCVRRWLQRLQCHAFGPRPLYLTRFRFTPVTSPAPRTPAPPYVSSRSEQAAVRAQMPPRAGAPASVKRSRASMFPRLARSDEWRESRRERGRGRGLVGEQSVGV